MKLTEQDSKVWAYHAAKAALNIKAADLLILDLSKLTSFTDYFVVCTGYSDRQVCAIADEVIKKMKTAGIVPLGIEGYDQGHWVLIDFGSVVVHVFHPESRAFYEIEKMWADAELVELPDENPARSAAS